MPAVLDQGMGYDTDGRRRSRPSPLRLALLGLGVFVGVVVLCAAVLVLLTDRAGPTATPATSTSASEPTAEPPPSTAGSPTASPSAAPSGNDAQGAAGMSPEASRTLREFMAGWLSTDSTKRRDLLTKTATPELTEQLMLTAKENVPTVRTTTAAVSGASETSVDVIQHLSDNSAVLVQLGVDPEGAYGWRVQNIEPWGE